MHARQQLGDRRHSAENAHSGRQHCTWRRDACLGQQSKVKPVTGCAAARVRHSRCSQCGFYRRSGPCCTGAALPSLTCWPFRRFFVRRRGSYFFGPSPPQTPLATVQDCAVVRCFTTYHSSGCFNCDSSQRRKNQNSHRFTVTNPVINIRKKNDRSLGGAGRSKKGPPFFGRVFASLQTATRRTALARPA